MARASANKDDPGYGFFIAHYGDRKKIKVYLDGVEVQLAVTADEDEGFVTIAKLDSCGFPIVDREKGEFVHERLEGDVRIEVEERDD